MNDIKKGILIGIGCCIGECVVYLIGILLNYVAECITDISEQGPKARFDFDGKKDETVVVGFRGTES